MFFIILEKNVYFSVWEFSEQNLTYPIRNYYFATYVLLVSCRNLIRKMFREFFNAGIFPTFGHFFGTNFFQKNITIIKLLKITFNFTAFACNTEIIN